MIKKRNVLKLYEKRGAIGKEDLRSGPAVVSFLPFPSPCDGAVINYLPPYHRLLPKK
jgi:hypothetical protein